MRGELRIETKSTSKMIVNKLSVDLPFRVDPIMYFSGQGEERKTCDPLVEDNLLAHLQGHVRWDQNYSQPLNLPGLQNLIITRSE